jgi:hypothetical protein
MPPSGVKVDTPTLAARRADWYAHGIRTVSGEPYLDTKWSSGGQFSTGWAGACQRAGLPGTVKVYRRKDRPTATYERYEPAHTPYVLRHTWASWHYCIHKDLKLLERNGGWESQDMPDVYARPLPKAYRDEALAFLSGEVDPRFNAPGVDRRFRAIAVQSGRTTPTGAPKTCRKCLKKMVLLEGIELSTSPLPRECSTTELQQRRVTGGAAS